MNNAMEDNLILRDTFEDSAGTLLTAHAPNFGGSAGDWYKMSTTGHDAKIDAGGDDLIHNGITGVQHGIDLSAAPSMLQIASATTGTPTLVGFNVYFRFDGTSGAAPPDGTIGLQYTNVFGTIGLTLAIWDGGSITTPTGVSASVPTTDMFSAKVSFVIQDDGRYLRYWIVGEEANTLKSYDTQLDSRINAKGGKSLCISFTAASACEVAGLECYG